MAFVRPFLGSALSGSSALHKPNGFGRSNNKQSINISPFQSVLSQFTGGGNIGGGDGGIPIQNYINLGMSALSSSGISNAMFSPKSLPAQRSPPLQSISKKFIARSVPSTKPFAALNSKAAVSSMSKFLRTDFGKLIPAALKTIKGGSAQPTMNLHMPSTKDVVWLKPSEQPALLRNSGAKDFGQKVVQMFNEISQYSDVHHQQYQDYGSVHLLMSSFFHAMAGESDSTPFKQLLPMNDGTEIGRNRPLTRNLFESDIVLTVDQLKGIVLAERDRRRGKGSRRRTKRKVITGGIYRWPKNVPIPYEFKEKDQSWRQVIRSALQFWQSETCLRWQENGPGFDRVVFLRGSGCYSSVGKTGGRQVISIGHGCENRGIVTHEVGHSLGFWHEQSRPDRDKYISIIHKYIAKGTEGNFIKRSSLESDDLGLPFDLGSVMHYGPNAFTTDWSHTTIETRDKKYGHTIGQREGPSFIDVKQVNRLYCHERCASSHLQCQNGGYPNPNNCNVCKCPTGLGGKLCTQVQPSSCGSEIVATDTWQHLSYKGNNKCYWRIKAQNARIRIILDSVSLQCDTTCHTFVEIKHNSDFQQTGFRTCCSEKELEVLSEQAEMLVIFDSAELHREGSFSLRYVKDSGKPLPKPPPPVWIPGTENRLFRNLELGVGPIEKFILNAIPQIRDPKRPIETIASIVTDFTMSQLLGVDRT